MAIKYNEETKDWTVSYAKRHPVTRMPASLRRTGIKSKADANRVYAELVLQVESKLHRTAVPSWQELVERFPESARQRQVSEKTIENYMLCLRAHTMDDWANRPVDTITTEEIRLLVKTKVGHKSVSHQKNFLKFIRAIFIYGVESGVLKRNPVPKMKFHVGDKLKAVLTEEQVRLLLTKSKEFRSEWYPHWTMAVYTGLRNGELYALTWDKVNLDDRLIKVDCAWNNVDGFKSTKSGDDRIIEIAPNLVALLKQLKLQAGDSNFVLPRIDKWDDGEQARELRMFLAGLGLPAIRFHDLRATWATLLLSKGVEPIKVMKMGGWKDMKTMMIYVRKAGVDIKGMTNCLDLHDPSLETAKVLKFGVRSDS